MWSSSLGSTVLFGWCWDECICKLLALRLEKITALLSRQQHVWYPGCVGTVWSSSCHLWPVQASMRILGTMLFLTYGIDAPCKWKSLVCCYYSGQKALQNCLLSPSSWEHTEKLPTCCLLLAGLRQRKPLEKPLLSTSCCTNKQTKYNVKRKSFWVLVASQESLYFKGLFFLSWVQKAI